MTCLLTRLLRCPKGHILMVILTIFYIDIIYPNGNEKWVSSRSNTKK